MKADVLRVSFARCMLTAYEDKSLRAVSVLKFGQYR